MKHLNQINALLVIVALATVFYSLSRTFFDSEGAPVRVVSSAEAPAGTVPVSNPEATVPETRSPRGRVPSAARPAGREAANPASRGAPIANSPQLVVPQQDESAGPSPRQDRTRVLTTPTPRRGSEPDDSAARPQVNPSQSSEFMDAVERLRQRQESGAVPGRPSSRPATTPDQTRREDRRRQAEPPPARSSMADRRPPL